jgi:NAD(P)-dependent dehydrogenase (short-subunit alcohol dehydrogenase family)
MTSLLKDKVVLITGAAGGIGRATAIAAACEGAQVALADLDIDRTQQTASLVAEAGASASALVLRTDISSAHDVESMMKSLIERFGRLDCAFNNAAIAQAQCGAASKKLGEIDEGAFNRIMQVNVIGTWLCMRSEIEHMRQHGGGVIVNASSVSGLVGRAGSGAYCASKHAIVGLTKTAALEYAASGIRVNAVCPGFIDTPFVQSSLATRGAKLLDSVPMNRLGHPDEVAQMVTWLFSDRASYVTGSMMGMDGGFMAG